MEPGFSRSLSQVLLARLTVDDYRLSLYDMIHQRKKSRRKQRHLKRHKNPEKELEEAAAKEEAAEIE
jgi:hypothetical protein